MQTSERTLYQFPISHFCEKTRWNLDAKGLSYRLENVVPGAHGRLMKRLSGVRTVPVLVDRGKAIGDSTAIALHLDEAYPDRPLVPKDPAKRERVLEIEDFFDKRVGTSVRQWVYGQLMRAKPGTAARALFMAYPRPVRIVGRVAAPVLEALLRRLYRINREGMERAVSFILAGADRIEAETGKDPSRYLVGDSLSIADIAAASMLGPVLAPHESPYSGTPVALPKAVAELREELRARPAGQWVAARYRHDRGGRAAGTAFRKP